MPVGKRLEKRLSRQNKTVKRIIQHHATGGRRRAAPAIEPPAANRQCVDWRCAAVPGRPSRRHDKGASTRLQRACPGRCSNARARPRRRVVEQNDGGRSGSGRVTRGVRRAICVGAGPIRSPARGSFRGRGPGKSPPARCRNYAPALFFTLGYATLRQPHVFCCVGRV